jgi:hypothetical protein
MKTKIKIKDVKMRKIFKRLIRKVLKKNVALSQKIIEDCLDKSQSAFVELKPNGVSRGRALLSYRIEGFLLDTGDPLLSRHNHFGEALAMAEVLLELGYEVDVISHLRTRLPIKRRYDIFLSSRTNFDQIVGQLNNDCITVVHLDTAHWTFNNHASLGRSLAVQHIRGITPERHITIEPNRAIERARYATMLGNEFVHATYAFAEKPIFQMINPAVKTYAWAADKDFAASRRRFLWLGSRGLAHKGLGLTLEAFARMPEMHLTVCGSLENEPCFVEAYRRELYETPNIHAHGWIDVTGPDFEAVVRDTLALVYPSCAEAQSGAVINCMQAGLIPVVSREAGLDTDPAFGLTLRDNSVETIMETVRGLAARPAPELETMARRAWEHARTTYTRENFKRILGGAIERIVAEHSNPSAEGFIRYARAPLHAPETPPPATSQP